MKSLGYRNWRHPPRGLWEMGRNIFIIRLYCICFVPAVALGVSLRDQLPQAQRSAICARF